MKKFLFALLALSCLTSFAQVRTRTYTFDIANPASLSPAVTGLGSAVGSSKEIDYSTVFKSTDGQLSMSFKRDSTVLMTVRIVRGMDNRPYLDMPRGVSMVLSVQEGSSIRGLRMPVGDGTGLSLEATDPEKQDDDPRFRLNVSKTGYQWPVDTRGNPVELTKDYISLELQNVSPAQTTIHQVEVDYVPPRDILIPTATSIAANATVSSFTGIDLTFDSNMSVTGDAVYSLSDGTSLSAKANGKMVTITPASAVVADGTYTLTVEAGSFESADGFRNQKLTYTFKVLRSLDITGISLAEGEVESIPTEMILTLDGKVGKVDDSLPIQIIDESGVVVATGKASKNGDTSVKLTFDKAVTGNGQYTLTIPEKLVYDEAGTHYNQKATYSYKIGDVASDELKAKAKQLLAMTGLGYPTSSSAARTALASLDAKASTADYTKAIAAYLQSTEVELPAADKYYYIAAVSKSGQKLYLQYGGGSISLTADAQGAVPLLAAAKGGAFSFATPDDKYLQLPGSSASSIGDLDAALTLGKLPSISGVDDEAIFGLFSLSAGSVHALVDMTKRAFATNASLSDFYFTEALSSGFKLELVPDDKLPTPTDDFTYDFIQKHNIYYKEDINQQTPVKDVYLNNMTLYTFDKDLTIYPSDKVVEIVDYNKNTVVTTGHFVTLDPKEIPGATSAIKLKLDKEITEGSLPAGTYSYIIHEGTFGDENFNLYNTDMPRFLAEVKKKSLCHTNPYIYYILTVDNARAGQTDPDPDEPGPGGDKEDHPSAAVLAKAQSLLGMTGVGYPASTASTRATLQQLVSSNKGTDATFNTAIQNYLRDTSIERPADGQYYTIAAVSADGTSAYVQEDGLLTFDSSKAGHFKATPTQDNETVFATDGGKYLTVLQTTGSITDKLNPAENNLDLKRFAVSVADPEKTFGLMTVQGIKNAVEYMSQVNVKTLTVTTKDNSAVFTDDVTSAFRISLTTKPEPDEPTPAPQVEYTLSPDGGEVEGPALEITLNFTNISGVRKADNALIVLTNGIQALAPQSVTGNEDGTQFVLAFDGLAAGSYTLNIGEGAFTYTFEGRTENVQAISSAKYDVTVKQYPSEKTIEKATAALAHEGVGYPTADSPARKALEQLLEAGEGSDDEFLEAIDAFIAETDIEKPADGKFYRLKAVGQSENFMIRNAYVGTDGNRLALTNAALSAAFKVTANDNGTLTLVTVDGKYLGLPSNGDCLSGEYSAESCDLTLSRLNVLGVDAAETFGLFSISHDDALFAAVNFNIKSVIAPLAEPCFAPMQSSGFTFEEVSADDIQMPTISYTLTPTSGTSVVTFEKATISFNTTFEVALKDISLIRLVDGIDANTVYRPVRVSAVEGQVNTFDIEFLNVTLLSDNRSCTLVIGGDAFVVDFMGREMPVRGQDITASYLVKKSIVENYDLDTTGNLRWEDQPADGEYGTTDALWAITMKADEPIVVLSEEPSVIIYKLTSYAPDAKGHFETTDDSTVVKLVFDQVEQKGLTTSGTYHLRIPAKTLGDMNYAQYMLDHESISLALCHVNPEMTITFNVDNSKATGITEVTAGEEGSPVYDLMGRRVSGQLQPGTVYVRDGRKFTYRRK